MREYAAGIQSSELSLVEVQTTAGAEPEESPPASSPASPPVHPSAPPEAQEDPYLARAKEEYARGHLDPTLWARAVAQADGQKQKAESIYFDVRATAIRVKKRQERAARKAQVVETLSREPDHGVELPPPVTASASKRPGRAARMNRKLMMLAGGVLACAVGIVAMVVLWPASAPDSGPSVAKAATPLQARTKTGPLAPPATQGATANPAGEDVVAKVHALEKDGNWNLLVIHTNEWTRKQPFNPEAWRMSSVGYAKLRQFSEALDAATKATELAPEDPALWQNLGQINLAVPRLPEALAAFQRATALNDRNIVSLAQEGTLNAQLGHFAAAKVAFDKAFALNPDDTTTLCGAALLASKEGRVKDAEAMTLRAMSLDGRCPLAVEGEAVRVATAPVAKKSVPSSGPRH